MVTKEWTISPYFPEESLFSSLQEQNKSKCGAGTAFQQWRTYFLLAPIHATIGQKRTSPLFHLIHHNWLSSWLFSLIICLFSWPFCPWKTQSSPRVLLSGIPFCCAHNKTRTGKWVLRFYSWPSPGSTLTGAPMGITSRASSTHCPWVRSSRAWQQGLWTKTPRSTAASLSSDPAIWDNSDGDAVLRTPFPKSNPLHEA